MKLRTKKYEKVLFLFGPQSTENAKLTTSSHGSHGEYFNLVFRHLDNETTQTCLCTSILV